MAPSTTNTAPTATATGSTTTVPSAAAGSNPATPGMAQTGGPATELPAMALLAAAAMGLALVRRTARI